MAFFEAASILDEKNVPSAGRTAVLSPRQYYGLISQVDTNILNRDFGNTQGNLNSPAKVSMKSLVSLSVVLTTCLSWLVLLTRVDGENNDYGGDFSAHCGLIYQRDAAGVVEGIGPSVQTTGGDVKAMYQGDMIIGRLAMGADWLNPAAAIELQAA